MSTPSELLEAEVWLEARDPGVAPELRARFMASADEYYTQYPTVGRRPDVLAILKEDNEAFTRIFDALLREDASPGADTVTSPLAHRVPELTH